jgi:hypothetical protein
MTNMYHGAGMARQPDDPGRRSRAGARSFAQQLEDAVRENPVPAALIGVGCLWMFMGGSRTSLFGNGRERSVFSPAIRSTGEAAHEVAQRGGSALTRAAGGVAETLSDLGTRAAEMTRTAAAAVGDAVSGMNPPTVEAASSAPENTGSPTARAVEAAPNWATKASQSAQHAGAEWTRSAQQSIADLFERRLCRPLRRKLVSWATQAGH